MSTSEADKHRNKELSAGNRVYIIGPRRLQNEAIASCLERKTKSQCVLLEDINQMSQEDLDDQGQSSLILLDWQGKGQERILDGLRPYLERRQSTDHVVLFNVSPDLGIEGKCVLEGIRGFFYEQDPLDMFLKGVQAVFSGELWLSREIMTKCIFEGRHQERASKRGSAVLTSRQIEILALVTVGATNGEIAERLCISPHTVKTHLYNTFKKINVPNRLQAALWAAKNL